MALWQHDLYLIPEKAAESTTRSKNAKFPFGDAWSHHPDPDTCEIAIASMMPSQPEAWAEDIVRVGHEKATHVQLVREADRLVEVNVRFDLREAACSFVPIAVHLCIVAEEQGLVFAYPDGRVIQATLDRLMNHLAASDAARYCRDPRAFRSGG